MGMQREQRKTTVLTSVIEQFINTGEPAPSVVIARESRLGLSPASIRSIMAELADEGYLEQPHISAGRVPTAKAFRLYVDTVLTLEPLAPAKKDAIAKALDMTNADISQLLRRACGMVSSHCLQLGVVLAPKRDELRWRAIEFSPLNANQVLAILILDGGLVRTHIVSVLLEYTNDELTRFSNYLNSNFKGCTLSDAKATIKAELALAGEKLEEMRRNALALSRPALDVTDEDREIFMDGISQVSHTSGFADAERLRELVSFMEERPKLLDLLERTMETRDISVSFIQGAPGKTPWAVVSAPYAPFAPREGHAPLGVVSAVGLVHMNYATVLPVVTHIACSVAGIMRRRLAIV